MLPPLDITQIIFIRVFIFAVCTFTNSYCTYTEKLNFPKGTLHAKLPENIINIDKTVDQ